MAFIRFYKDVIFAPETAWNWTTGVVSIIFNDEIIHKHSDTEFFFIAEKKYNEHVWEKLFAKEKLCILIFEYQTFF